MHNALRVSRIERVGELNAKVQDFIHLERLCRNAVLERLAFQQLHHNERLTFMFANVVNRANVRVIESRGRTSFPLKALQGLTIFGKLLRQELEGHETAETSVFSLVHHTHPASAQLVNDSIVPESAANHGKQPGLESAS